MKCAYSVGVKGNIEMRPQDQSLDVHGVRFRFEGEHLRDMVTRCAEISYKMIELLHFRMV